VTLDRTKDEVKRPYHAPRREAQARATREAILDAALELFMSQGFQTTAIREIAERAEVSEQTVYNAFGDKIGLLWNAGMRYIDAGGGAEEQAFLDALRAEPDPLKRVRMAARDSRQTWESGALELDLMTLSTDARDERLHELAERGLRHKLASTRAVCEILFPDEIRRRDLSLDDVIEFATAVDSAATVTTLIKLGWTMERWERWIAEFLLLFLDPDRIS
jgi:AcrR family transcriptional regulator